MNTKTTKIIDHPDLIRDMNSKAVLNTNLEKYEEYKKRKNFLKDLMNQGDEIQNLKKDISEIKELLQALIAKK